MLKAFAGETKASDFFKNNAYLYNKMVDDFVKETLSFNHIQRIQEFYGIDLSQNQFKIVLTSLERGASALDIGDDYSSGFRTYYNVMDPYGSKDYMFNNLYHETAHSYYSSIRKQTEGLLNQYSAYKDTIGDNSPEDTFDRSFNETLARVITFIMLEQYHGKEMATTNLNKEMSMGWKNLDKLCALVKVEYLPHREQYKTFDAFFPVILEYIKGLS